MDLTTWAQGVFRSESLLAAEPAGHRAAQRVGQ
jgi:hypothetical protein